LKTLQAQNIYLRALEPEDLEFVYAIENNVNIWEVSNTQTPYSKFLIKQYLENAHQDIFEAKQLRLVICKNHSFKAIGLIDLFDYDPKNSRIGIGILINKETDRNNGVGSQALDLLIDYCFGILNIHQLFANISSENEASLALFTKFGFQFVGTKKQWNLVNGIYKDENLYQLINPK
jgi:diamine N-acetyltransferase